MICQVAPGPSCRPSPHLLCPGSLSSAHCPDRSSPGPYVQALNSSWGPAPGTMRCSQKNGLKGELPRTQQTADTSQGTISGSSMSPTGTPSWKNCPMDEPGGTVLREMPLTPGSGGKAAAHAQLGTPWSRGSSALLRRRSDSWRPLDIPPLSSVLAATLGSVPIGCVHLCGPQGRIGRQAPGSWGSCSPCQGPAVAPPGWSPLASR